MKEPNTPAYDELERILKDAEYHAQRVVVIDNGPWSRLRAETRDPFEGPNRKLLWYKNWTMLLPASSVLDCTKEPNHGNR